MPHLRRGALRDFKHLIARLRVEERKSEKLFIFPSRAAIEFFSADQSAKLRGAQRDWLFVNEVNLLDEESFSELDVRTREFVIVDFNPTARFWLSEYLEARKGVWLECVSTYRDNVYLSAEQRAAIELRKDQEAWWRVYGEGEWGEVAGQAWYSWSVGQGAPPGRFEVVGVDFSLGRAPAAVVGVARRGHELAAVELAYGGLGVLALAQLLSTVQTQLIVADAAQLDMINQLRSLNIDVYPARKLQLSASYALLNMQRWRLWGENLIKEARSVRWADSARGLIALGVDDHAVDATRYALHALLG
jgi:phage terminase large subunit